MSPYTTGIWIAVTPRIGEYTPIYALTVFNNKLYGSAVGRLYEWNGINAWKRVANRLRAAETINSLAVYNGKLYGGTNNGELYEWNGVNAWKRVAPKLGTVSYIPSLAVYNGKLYGGTNSGELYEWNGLNAWIEVSPQLNSEQYIPSLAVYNNKLYGGTGNNGKLYEWNGVNAWIEVAPQLGTVEDIQSLTVYNNKLYGGTDYGGKLYEWNGLNAWIEVAPQFGLVYYIRSLAVYNERLHGGTSSGTLLRWNNIDAWIEAAPILGLAPDIYSLTVYNNKLYGGTYNGKLYEYIECPDFCDYINHIKYSNGVYDIETEKCIYDIEVNSAECGYDVRKIPQSEMNIIYVDSESINHPDFKNPPSNMLDGDPNTYWITEWYLEKHPYPHEVQIYLGGIYNVDGFKYMPPHDTLETILIKDYEFYVSNDPTDWGQPVSVGTFPLNRNEQEVLFPLKKGQYVRLVALSGFNVDYYSAAIAELNVFGSIPLDPCGDVTCIDVCVEKDLWSQVCDPINSKCIPYQLIESNSSLCDYDPCEGVVCPNVCVGPNLWSQSCDTNTGKCILNQIIQLDSITCKIPEQTPSDETNIQTYLIIGGLGVVALAILMATKKS